MVCVMCNVKLHILSTMYICIPTPISTYSICKCICICIHICVWFCICIFICICIQIIWHIACMFSTVHVWMSQMCLHCWINTGVMPYRYRMNNEFPLFSQNTCSGYLISFQQRESHVRIFADYLESFGCDFLEQDQAAKHAEQVKCLMHKSTEAIHSADFLVYMARVIDTPMHSRWHPNTIHV